MLMLMEGGGDGQVCLTVHKVRTRSKTLEDFPKFSFRLKKSHFSAVFTWFQFKIWDKLWPISFILPDFEVFAEMGCKMCKRSEFQFLKERLKPSTRTVINNFRNGGHRDFQFCCFGHFLDRFLY